MSHTRMDEADLMEGRTTWTAGAGRVCETNEAPSPWLEADSLRPVYQDDAERAAVLLPDPSRAAFDELVALTVRCFEADGVPAGAALSFVADLRGFGEPFPETPNAQDAPRTLWLRFGEGARTLPRPAGCPGPGGLALAPDRPRARGLPGHPGRSASPGKARRSP